MDKRREASDPSASSQPLRVEDDDRLAVEAQPPTAGEVGQCLVDRLPGSTHELGDLFLGQVVGDPQDTAVPGAEPASHLEQVLRHAARHVGEDQISQGVVGTPQAAGQDAQELFGDLRAVVEPGAQRLLAEAGQAGVGDRRGGRRARSRVEQGQLAHHVGRAHHRDQVLPTVGGPAADLDLPAQHDVKAVAWFALVEDNLALTGLDGLHVLGERLGRLRVYTLEDAATGQNLIHRAPQFHEWRGNRAQSV